jgi:uncharacterized caspase-like protein
VLGRVYFFFAWHGSPEPTKGTAYLLPYDGDPRVLDATALVADDVLKRLARTKATEVVAFVDACFSGAGGRSVPSPGARPLVRVVGPTPPVATGLGSAKIALFSSAKADQVSGPLPGQPVGLFTHLVVRGLGAAEADVNGDGNVALDELAQWVPARVENEAKKDNRAQTPTLATSAGFGDTKAVLLGVGVGAK